MSNLIVTILAILLAAAVALAGIYYGGNVFAEATLRSRAAAVREDLQQIAGAMKLYYVQEQAGSMVFPSGTIFTALDHLVPRYLQSLPRKPWYATTQFWRVYSFDETTGTVTLNVVAGPVNAVAAYIADVPDSSDALLCREFVRAAGEEGGYLARPGPGFGLGPFGAMTKRFYCMFNDTNANGTLEDNEQNVFLIYYFG